MTHVYGPIPSRRLGRSLGIDPIPLKTCNWNCVYCQLGRTSPPTNERREYVGAEGVVSEVNAALRGHATADIDWITFAGSGEPTLHARLGWMIRRIKALTELPIAVITNGSLLSLPAVRHELLAADAVLPSLDAGSKDIFLKVTRPHASLSFEKHIDGLVTFSKEYEGSLWVEVMLVRGLNDSKAALADLASVLRRIRPDQVHINLPVRPPCEPWVKPADKEGLQRAVSALGDVARVIPPVASVLDLAGSSDLVDAVLAVIGRHPIREEELVATLDRWSPGEVGQILRSLHRSDQAQVVTRFGQRFWTSAGALYVDEELSRRHRPETSDGPQ